jgi:hypothetical protein
MRCIVAQEKKIAVPFGTFQTSNLTTYGLSIGIASGAKEITNNKTNGIRLELIGLGLLVPIIPQSPIISSDKELHPDSVSEEINGLNLSATGSVCNCRINGVSVGYVGEIVYQVNGFSATAIMNFVQVHYGIQGAFLYSENYKMNGLQISAFNNSTHTKGLQIGLINSSTDLRGFQIGIWNKNGKRALPIVNWQFRG